MKKLLKGTVLLFALLTFLLGGAFFGAAVGFSQLAVPFFLMAEILLPLKKLEVPLLGGFKLTLQKVK